MAIFAENFYFPQLVRIDATWRCNLRCKHCQTGMFREPGSSYDDLNTEQLFTIFSQLSEMGTESIGFLGGEPLLRHDFFKLALNLNQLGIRPAITTNGWLVNDRRAIQLTQEYPTDVTVSFDGPEQLSHDWLRGTGSFTRAEQAIKLLSRHKSKKKPISVGVSSVITARNIENAVGFLELAARLEVDFLIVAVVHPTGTAKENWDDLSVPYERLLQCLRELLITYELLGAPFQLRINLLTPALRHMLASEGLSVPEARTYYDRSALYEAYIQCDGRMWPSQKCSVMDPSVLTALEPYGISFDHNSLQEQSVADIWFGEAFEAYRDLVLGRNHVTQYSSCSVCPYAKTTCFPTAMPFVLGENHAQGICGYAYDLHAPPFNKALATNS